MVIGQELLEMGQVGRCKQKNERSQVHKQVNKQIRNSVSRQASSWSGWRPP